MKNRRQGLDILIKIKYYYYALDMCWKLRRHDDNDMHQNLW